MSRVGSSTVGLPIRDSSFGLVEKWGDEAYHELLARLGRILRELPRGGFLRGMRRSRGLQGPYFFAQLF